MLVEHFPFTDQAVMSPLDALIMEATSTSKRRFASTNEQGAVLQKGVIFIFAAFRTRNLAVYTCTP
jgi:hypothetical protein